MPHNIGEEYFTVSRISQNCFFQQNQEKEFVVCEDDSKEEKYTNPVNSSFVIRLFKDLEKKVFTQTISWKTHTHDYRAMRNILDREDPDFKKPVIDVHREPFWEDAADLQNIFKETEELHIIYKYVEYLPCGVHDDYEELDSDYEQEDEMDEEDDDDTSDIEGSYCAACLQKL